MEDGMLIHSLSLKRPYPFKLKRLRKGGGFTLVEVMISVGIFATVAICSSSLVCAMWTTVRKTEERIYVNRILESRLEELRDLTFDELEALPTVSEFAVLPATTVYGKPVNPDAVDTQYQFNLVDPLGRVYIDPVSTGFKEVTVLASWKPWKSNDETNNRLNMSIVTYIARNGVNRQ